MAIEHIGFGIMGGLNQPLAHAQFVSNVVDYHMNFQAAMEEPRFTDEQQLACKIVIESRVTQATIDALTKWGTCCRCIRTTHRRWAAARLFCTTARRVQLGASDPRADGAAIPEQPDFSRVPPRP